MLRKKKRISISTKILFLLYKCKLINSKAKYLNYGRQKLYLNLYNSCIKANLGPKGAQVFTVDVIVAAVMQQTWSVFAASVVSPF